MKTDNEICSTGTWSGFGMWRDKKRLESQMKNNGYAVFSTLVNQTGEPIKENWRTYGTGSNIMAETEI